MKPKCEWCGEEEYHIAILNESGEEELLCKNCYKGYKLDC